MREGGGLKRHLIPVAAALASPGRGQGGKWVHAIWQHRTCEPELTRSRKTALNGIYCLSCFLI